MPTGATTSAKADVSGVIMSMAAANNRNGHLFISVTGMVFIPIRSRHSILKPDGHDSGAADSIGMGLSLTRVTVTRGM
jgi:hypothetical protein